MRSLVKQLLRNREIRRHTAAPADRLHPPTRPDPNGWFCVAFSDEVRPGAITTRPIMGGEVVVYRTPRGLLRAVPPAARTSGRTWASVEHSKVRRSSVPSTGSPSTPPGPRTDRVRPCRRPRRP